MKVAVIGADGRLGNKTVSLFSTTSLRVRRTSVSKGRMHACPA